MASISSPGLGSLLDVTSIVDQLVALERKPIERLEATAQTIQAKLSSFGLLQNYLTNLRDAADRLAAPTFWQQTVATSADPLSVTAAGSASAVPGSYLVEVSRLAQAQSLSSKAFSGGSSATVGSGTLHIQLGSWDAGTTAFTPGSAAAIDIVIAPADNTLAGIRDAINAADAGVSASIVNDTTGARLVIRAADTGAAQAVRITATDDDASHTDNNGLSAISFDPPTAAGRMTQNLAGLDALATVNGLPIVSAGNKLQNVVEGVTLTLSKVTTAAVDVRVSMGTDAMKKSVGDFVKAYNDIQKYIADQTKYDSESKVAGLLQGDRSTLGVQSQLRTAMQAVSSASSVFGRLSTLGIEVQKDGSLKLDDARLSDAMTADLDEVALAFSRDDAGGRGFAVAIEQLADALTDSDGSVALRSQGLRDSIRRNEKEQDRLEERVAATRERLLRQYSALDAQMSKLKGLEAYITQQIAAFNNSLKRDD